MRTVTPVLLSGGSGTRLWPVSRSLHPKQLLPITSKLTMFQETARRFAGAEGYSAPLVVCNDDHRFVVAAQLQELEIKPETIVLEPVGRNTAPAAAAAALILAERVPDNLMLLAASDHAIDDVAGLLAAMRLGAGAAEAGRLVTFGIRPTRAETGYGYICRGSELSEAPGAYSVARFVEKPLRDAAEQFVASGNYLWNASLFLFSPAAYLQELNVHAPEVLERARLALEKGRRDLDFLRLDREIFSACPSISIDYAVMEHTTKAVVVPTDIGWSDVGSWSTLWERGDKDEAGNVLLGDAIVHDAKGNFVRSDKGLVAALGIENLIVVVTNDAVLIAPRARDQEVKQLVDRLAKLGRTEVSQHARVYRPWGFFETLHLAAGTQVKLIEVNPGAALSLQFHHKRAEHWVVVSGEAEIVRGDQRLTLKQNESTFIPIGMQHRLENKGREPLRLIEVQVGHYLGEDDIVRLEDRYRRNET
jgi:mannose-1-phosphate guanylyltransferase/mannose-6-phosphate isomerase